MHDEPPLETQAYTRHHACLARLLWHLGYLFGVPMGRRTVGIRSSNETSLNQADRQGMGLLTGQIRGVRQRTGMA